MEGIKLDKRKFEWWNDCDHHCVFKAKMDQEYNSLPDDLKASFDHDEYLSFAVDDLFHKYDFIIITPKDEVFGVKDGAETFICNCPEGYECALDVK
jgi:hypothetical protein